ncbi:glycosyltransferase family 2 protein [Konateibacter massiliensis]|uniref:glycosyltransferase family 2 protein n=1 Tax=Konateibacter massiliensis TaxID=2002841 RepID=UPI000C1516F6|nr:glycosyltransferase family 2 protein [Konateibacter massiliensis]
MKDRILLFIPGYNCEKQIVRVLGQLDQDILQYIDKVIMVNNRSTDGTEEAVKAFIEENPAIPLALLRNDDNYGLGGSHKVAFDYAMWENFDYVIVLHGDDQGDIHDLKVVLKKKLYQKYDCCLGARFMNGSKLKGYSAFRTFGNIVYNMLFSIVVQKRIFDLGSGLNMYSVDMLRERFYEKFPDNLMFNYCMIMAADYYKQNIVFFPISWREDDQVSNVKMVNQAITVLKMLGSYFTGKKKFITSDMRERSIEEYSAKVIAESRIAESDEEE